MWDSTAILYKRTGTTYDTAGNGTPTFRKTTVFVQPRGVYSSEFYSAAQAGLHPSVTLVLTNRMDYDGEKLVEWDGKVYNIIRADWTAQRDSISLVCEERIEP